MLTPALHGPNAEARAVASRIRSKWRPERTYTSPLSRCIATGRAIARACGIEAQSIEQLNDINNGTWQMKSHEEMDAAEPTLYAIWFAAPHLMRFPGLLSSDEQARTCWDVFWRSPAASPRPRRRAATIKRTPLIIPSTLPRFPPKSAPLCTRVAMSHAPFTPSRNIAITCVS